MGMTIQEIKALRDTEFGEALAALPPLTGTEKQIAWATKIRSEKLEHLTRAIVCAREALVHPSDNVARIAAFCKRRDVLQSRWDEWSRQTEARWWIDRRDTNAADFDFSVA